jgi:hypothetical protein
VSCFKHDNHCHNSLSAPPTNETTFHKWTIGPIYYSALIVAEAIGPSNNTQIRDLGANSNEPLTPAYGIYENGVPVRIALFNFISDPSGASEYTANITIGGQTPSSVKVK